jgi:hypothetical protein
MKAVVLRKCRRRYNLYWSTVALKVLSFMFVVVVLFSNFSIQLYRAKKVMMVFGFFQKVSNFLTVANEKSRLAHMDLFALNFEFLTHCWTK